MTKKCIIIPAFNEGENIAAVVQGVKKFSDADIVVIDDGSPDLTAEKAMSAGAFVISHPFNMGYGVALQTGYKYAVRKHYDFLVQMDGDGQHDPKYIPELMKPVESGECDLVLGSRFLGDTGYRAGFLKSIGIAIISNLAKVDTKDKFDRIFDKFYNLLNDKSMITAANLVGHSGMIAKTKPKLQNKITNRLLNIDKTHHSPECKNIIKGKAILSFNEYFDEAKDKKKIIEFVKRELKNTRPATRKKAEKFLKMWDKSCF